MSNEIPVAEMFLSIQGEGPHAGTPAVFLRLAGCNLSCGWHDDLEEYEPGDEPQGDATWVCIHEDEEVWLADGSRNPISDIEVGDKVLTKPFNEQVRVGTDEVVKVAPRGEKQLMELTLSDGRAVKATPDHEFYVNRDDGRGNSRRELQDIEEGDVVQAIPEMDPMDGQRPPDFDWQEWYAGYAKGVIAGDGYVTKTNDYNQPVVQLDSIDLVLVETFQDACAAISGEAPPLYEGYSETSAGNPVHRVRTGKHSVYDAVTEPLDTDSESQKRGWMAGFFDAEGHCSDGHLFIAQIESEAKDVATSLLEEFGFEYQVTPDEIFLEPKDAVEFQETFRPVLSRKFDWATEKFWKMEVEDVSPCGSGEVYDLETAESKRFVTNGVLTKNCDSIATWREADSVYEPQELLDDWAARGWTDALIDQDTHVVLTGGEPTLPARQKAFIGFVAEWLERYDETPYIEVETNGTIDPQPTFARYINQFNVSLKLSNSGMDEERRINPDALEYYAGAVEDGIANFKFVVGQESDVDEIFEIIEDHSIPHDGVMLMPAGANQEDLAVTYPEVAELCKEYGFDFSPRLHIDLWDMATGV